MLCAIARNLEDGQVEEIRGLERDLGLTVVAFSCRSVDPAREEKLRKIEAELGPSLQTDPAEPSEEQLASIRELEARMGLALLAVRA